MADLVVIVPTRGRPGNAAAVVQAWIETGAFEQGAALSFVIDESDPCRREYLETIAVVGAGHEVHIVTDGGPWRPMVPKLNSAAEMYARGDDELLGLGFAGDDHQPRSRGWARRYIEVLRDLGTGIVYGADGMRAGQEYPLPTQWAMTTDIVLSLGRMIPADVEHLYCDNVIRDLGRAAGCLVHLPDVMIEHMHPLAQKAQLDEGYRRVNSTGQYVRDKAAYAEWRYEGGFDRDVALVRSLTREVPE